MMDEALASVRVFDAKTPIGLSGLGAHAPEQQRKSGDLAYTELERGSRFAPLFFGYETRHVLARGSLAELMQRAATVALERSGRRPKSVGLLTGYASVSEYLAPNELFRLHRLLSLPESTQVLPVADEFTSFISGITLAADRIECGRLEVALVSVGSRWTENVSYRDPVSASLGDAAAAAVVERLSPAHRGCLRLVAQAYEVPAGMYGLMRVAPRCGSDAVTLQHQGELSRPLFTMLPESEALFCEWGLEVPPRLARKVLRKCRVEESQVTVIGHQATEHLLDGWRKRLHPATLLETLKTYGNMTLASIPFTLAKLDESIRTPFVLLLGLGLGIHASACLLERTR